MSEEWLPRDAGSVQDEQIQWVGRHIGYTGNYEESSGQHMRGLYPVDRVQFGKLFHSYLKELNKPYSYDISNSINKGGDIVEGQWYIMYVVKGKDTIKQPFTTYESFGLYYPYRKSRGFYLRIYFGDEWRFFLNQAYDVAGSLEKDWDGGSTKAFGGSLILVPLPDINVFINWPQENPLEVKG